MAITITATPGANTISLSWTDTEATGVWYIYRGATPGAYSGVFIGEASSPSYVDSVLGQTYYYTVENAATLSIGTVSATATGSTTLAAPTPTLLNSAPANTQIDWNPVAGAEYYEVYRSTTSGILGSFFALRDGFTSDYTDTSTVSGTTYYYTIRTTATDNSGATIYSAYSAQLAVTAGVSLPTPIVTGCMEADGTSARVSWGAVTGATQYHLYAHTRPDTLGTLFATVTGLTYTFPSRPKGLDSWYSVIADNGTTQSSPGKVMLRGYGRCEYGDTFTRTQSPGWGTPWYHWYGGNTANTTSSNPPDVDGSKGRLSQGNGGSVSNYMSSTLAGCYTGSFRARACVQLNATPIPDPAFTDRAYTTQCAIQGYIDDEGVDGAQDIVAALYCNEAGAATGAVGGAGVLSNGNIFDITTPLGFAVAPGSWYWIELRCTKTVTELTAEAWFWPDGSAQPSTPTVTYTYTTTSFWQARGNVGVGEQSWVSTNTIYWSVDDFFFHNYDCSSPCVVPTAWRFYIA